MKLTLQLAAALSAFGLAAHAEPLGGGEHAGDASEIRIERVSQTTGDGLNGGSRDVWTAIERVVAIRDGGLELEFDLPANTSEDERRISWQFPVRVFKSPGHPLELLNEEAVNARLQAWLGTDAALRAECGHWVFTWTAQKIECDPRTAIDSARIFDLRPDDLNEGAAYSEEGVIAPARLRAEQRDTGRVLVAEMQVDPDAIRRQRAESDVVIAEMLRRSPLTMEDALRAHAADQVSGTVVVTLELDASGRVIRRTRLVRTDITDAQGAVQHQTANEVAERHQLTPTAH